MHFYNTSSNIVRISIDGTPNLSTKDKIISEISKWKTAQQSNEGKAGWKIVPKFSRSEHLTINAAKIQVKISICKYISPKYLNLFCNFTKPYQASIEDQLCKFSKCFQYWQLYNKIYCLAILLHIKRQFLIKCKVTKSASLDSKPHSKQHNKYPVGNVSELC